jgi:putative membrane protein
MTLLDALLAFAHYASFVLIAVFLTTEVTLLRSEIGKRELDLLARADMGYFLCAAAVLLAGALRFGTSAKGLVFYAGNMTFWVKMLVFFSIALLSLLPTRRYARWRRLGNMDPTFRVPAGEAASTRRVVLFELGGIGLLLLLAALMARGIGG